MPAAVVSPSGSEHEGNGELRPIERQESCRQDADHGERLAIQRDVAADDVRGSTKTTLPELVGQDDHLVLARLVLVGGKDPSEHGPGAQKLQAVRGNPHAGDPFRLARTREVQGGVVEGGEALELRALRPPIHEHTGRNGDLGARRGNLEGLNELTGLLVGQRLEDDRIDDAEDRRRRPDAQGKGQDRHGREPALARQRTDGVAQILQELARATPSLALPAPAPGCWPRCRTSAGPSSAPRRDSCRP